MIPDIGSLEYAQYLRKEKNQLMDKPSYTVYSGSWTEQLSSYSTKSSKKKKRKLEMIK